MHKLILMYCLLFLLGATSIFGQNYCITNRFTDANYFKEKDIQVKDSIVYGKAKDWKGRKLALDLAIFYPKLSVDSIQKRPLVMLIHGGSFINGTKERLYKEAIALAKRGFVTASINYRLGWNMKTYLGKKKWDSSFYMAVYRSIQDSKAALRYLVHNASKYGIDTSWIFIGGSSAGAVTSLYTAYYTKANWNKYIPKLSNKLGDIDKASNNLTDVYTLKGVLDMWGGIADTASISMEAAKHIAILIFHGAADPIVPYIKSDEASMLMVHGGYLIAQRYKNLGGFYQLNTKVNGGHGEDFSPEFIAEKTGAFYKSLFCGNCKSDEFSTTVSKKPASTPSTLPLILAMKASALAAKQHIFKKAETDSTRVNEQ
jgi:acetyl esterase/lipase